MQTVVISILVFLALLALTFLVSLVRAPALVDNDSQAIIRQRDAEIDRLSLRKLQVLQFSLRSESAIFVGMLMKSGISKSQVKVNKSILTVWNNGQEHFRVASLKLSKNQYTVRKAADLIVQHSDSAEIDVSRDLMEVLSQSDSVGFNEIRGKHRVEVSITCQPEHGSARESDAKSFDVEVTHTGGGMEFSVVISPTGP